MRAGAKGKKWLKKPTRVSPLRDPGEGQIRIKVKAAGISPTDLVLRAGYVKAIPLPPNAVLGFEAAGTVDAVGPGVTGTSIGDGVTALLLGLGGYAEYALASIWTRKPDTVSWIDAAALPSSAEAAVGVLRQLNVKSGETLLLFGGGGSVGIIATQLAVARGIKVISAPPGRQDTGPGAGSFRPEPARSWTAATPPSPRPLRRSRAPGRPPDRRCAAPRAASGARGRRRPHGPARRTRWHRQ